MENDYSSLNELEVVPWWQNMTLRMTERLP
jgi:hypothetical protein